MPAVCTTCLKEAPDGAKRCPNPRCSAEQDELVTSLIGRVLDGRYRVERLLGVGAMGEIWHAAHVHTGQPRAIKILAPTDSDEASTNRFLHELRATALADNAHTATVYEAGTLGDGRLYLALELVEGRTLEDDMLMRRSAGRENAWRRVAHIAAQICVSLDCAHRVGVVHRDLKPANVMLAPRDGDPLFTKVLDFGIATITAASGTSGAVRQGMVAGTPEYMSPEQLHGGKPVDHRTDLYSLGVLMFEMLTGGPPLTGATPLEIAKARHRRVAPLVRLARPDVPEPMSGLIAELLAKEPDERPPSAAAVRERLRALLGLPRTGTSQVVVAPRPSEVSRVATRAPRSWRRAVAVALVVLLTGSVAWGVSTLMARDEGGSGRGIAPAARELPLPPRPAPPPKADQQAAPTTSEDPLAVGLGEGEQAEP
jgi:serine/threonine protein kinase